MHPCSAHSEFPDTARFFVAMMQPYDSNEEDEYKLERPDDRMHYRNYPARPAVEVLEELVAKFRDLEWIPMRDDQGWPEILTAQHDEDEKRPNLVCLAFLVQLY